MAGFVGHGTKINGLLKFHFEPAISKYSRPTRLNQTSQLSRFGRVTHDFRPFLTMSQFLTMVVGCFNK